MSRIGKLPVNLPAGVSVQLLDGNVVKVKGPLGEMSQKVDPDITVTIEDNEIKFTRPTDQPRHRSMHGLYRALVHNMVVGVSEGFTIKQELVGVGYRVAVQGQLLIFSLGYSHEIHLMLPAEVKAEVPKSRRVRLPSWCSRAATSSLLARLPPRSAHSASLNLTRARVSSSLVNNFVARQARLLLLNKGGQNYGIK